MCIHEIDATCTLTLTTPTPTTTTLCRRYNMFFFSFFHFSIAEMVKGKGKRARQTRNLLLKMNSDNLMGPSNALKEWKIQQKRIKVRQGHAQVTMRVNAFTGCFAFEQFQFSFAQNSILNVWFICDFMWKFPCRSLRGM